MKRALLILTVLAVSAVAGQGSSDGCDAFRHACVWHAALVEHQCEMDPNNDCSDVFLNEYYACMLPVAMVCPLRLPKKRR